MHLDPQNPARIVLTRKPCETHVWDDSYISCPQCAGKPRPGYIGQRCCTKCNDRARLTRTPGLIPNYESKTRICPRCNGTGYVPETLTDYIPRNHPIYDTFTITVIRRSALPWIMQNLGFGSVMSSTDYGAMASQPNDAAIVAGIRKDLKQSSMQQICKFVNKDLTIRPNIVVCVVPNGYAVISLDDNLVAKIGVPA